MHFCRDTRLILVSAVYFLSDWHEKFKPRNTKQDIFHVSATETAKVEMMHMVADFSYAANSRCQAIELPYVDNGLSMFIILPNRGTSLAQLEEELTADDFVNVRERFGGFYEAEVRLWLPKFKLDEQLSLVEALAALGIDDLFRYGEADLSGIDRTRDLYVSAVVHRAVVAVDENGTEAAAATAFGCVPTCFAMPERRRAEFRADHPFVFFIRHNATNSILFIGRLTRPPSRQ